MNRLTYRYYKDVRYMRIWQQLLLQHKLDVDIRSSIICPELNCTYKLVISKIYHYKLSNVYTWLIYRKLLRNNCNETKFLRILLRHCDQWSTDNKGRYFWLRIFGEVRLVCFLQSPLILVFIKAHGTQNRTAETHITL